MTHTKRIIKIIISLLMIIALCFTAFIVFYNWHANKIELFAKNIPSLSNISEIKEAAENLPFSKVTLSEGYFFDLDGEDVWINDSINIDSSLFGRAVGCSKYAKRSITTDEYRCHNLSATYAFFDLFIDIEKHIE